MGRKRESRKNTGEQTSSSMPLCVKGKKKKSVVQNGTVVFLKKKKEKEMNFRITKKLDMTTI